MKQKTNVLHIVTELIVLFAAIGILLNPVKADDYRRFATDTLHYFRATVLKVEKENLTDSPLGSGQRLGEQSLRLRLSDGQEITVTNYLTETHNVLLKEGDRAIICADIPKNSVPYYTVYNYDRTLPMLELLGIFVLLLVAIGRRKGLDACLAIAFTLLFILRVLLPTLYNGGSPMLMGIITVILSTTVTLVLINGPTVQCILGIGGTLLGEFSACILFLIFSHLFHLTGFQTDSAEGLLLIAQNTGLNIRTLLFAGIMIASLGAVMDVAVSVLSALKEVAMAANRPMPSMLFHSALRLGQDMIGTMSNTLIFAFTGGALVTMLVFYSYGVQFNQLFSSDYLVIELTQGICSTAAVILTVPAAAAIGALYYGNLLHGRK